MSKFLNAAETLRNQAEKWKGITDAAAALEEIGSLEQMANEQRSAVASLTEERKAIETQIGEARTALAGVVSSTETAVRDATGRAKNIVAEARSNAKTEADALLSEARGQAMLERASLAALKQEAKEAASNVTTARAELVEVGERLARARDSVKSLLGAGA